MTRDEIIYQARNADLAKYLLMCNVPLKKTGNYYRHCDHDSLVIKGCFYYWNSRAEYGNSVDYLTRHMNFSFIHAVEVLSNETIHNAEPNTRPLAFRTPERTISRNYKRVIAYLTQTRGIDQTIVKHLIESKHLYQEEKTNNALFAMYDERGLQVVGYEVQGTYSEIRFKGIAANSKEGYGFNVRFPATNDNHFKYTLFFESAVDLLSFIDIKARYENKSLERCILTSMSGLKLNVIKHTLDVFSASFSTAKPVVCLAIDNDPAADHFRDKLTAEAIEYRDVRPAHEYKDFNDQLRAIKNNRP